MRTLASALSSLVTSYNHFLNAEHIDDIKRADDVEERIEELVRNTMPSGGGFDSGTTIDLDKSTPNKLVFHTSFHHMTEGMYDGWTEHTVTVTPTFQGVNIKVGGRDRDDIKDYIVELFDGLLLGDAPSEY